MTTYAHTRSAHLLREALAEYVDLARLRQLAALDGATLWQALRTPDAPPEVLALLDALGALLTPQPRQSITAPADVAALLLVELGALPQEQFHVVCLDTKNHVQCVHLVYQGTINSAAVRVADVLREPIRRASAAIILAHNHPSGDPTPSAEDIAVTQQIRVAGALLDIQVLDHLVIGQGQWVSMRERRMGFDC